MSGRSSALVIVVSLVSAVIGGAVTAGIFIAAGVGDDGEGAQTTVTVESDAAAAAGGSTPNADENGSGGGSASLAAPGLGTNAVANLFERTSPSVVQIEAIVSQPVQTPFGPREGGSSGSGFVYDEKGHIVTNAHVVDGAEEVTVSFGGQEEIPAEIAGSFLSTDVAVLEVDADKVPSPALAIADSAGVKVGNPVVAIGNPFGLDRTVTVGIVSALQREIQAPDGTLITDIVQTDAAINPGNSGGPLLDANGRVVGVNTQILSESGGNVGIGFAVPSDTVVRIADQLIENGTAELAFLGIGGEGLTAELADREGLPNDLEGLLVGQVTPNSGAEAAGLQRGDVITTIDGEPITDSPELAAAVVKKEVGVEVQVTLVRDGDEQTVSATLGARPNP
jgi:S1-C subfamily serine protease